MPTPFALVMTTCGDKTNAELIATTLVEKRLAACVQMFPIASVYRWEGAVQQAEEWMLLGKIRAADYADGRGGSLQPGIAYSTPEIIEIGIENGAPTYLKWIASVTGRQ